MQLELPWISSPEIRKLVHVQRHSGSGRGPYHRQPAGAAVMQVLGLSGGCECLPPCRLNWLVSFDASEKQWEFWKQEYKLLRHLILPGLPEMWWQVLIWSVIYRPSCSSLKGSQRREREVLLFMNVDARTHWCTEETHWLHKHAQEVSPPPRNWQRPDF